MSWNGLAEATTRRWTTGAAARATTPRRWSRAQLTASLLLAWLVNGLLIMSLTRGWIGAVPFHDHVGFGPHDHGALGATHRHADGGNVLAPALASPEWGERWSQGVADITGPTTAPIPGARVVSLRSGSAAQFGFSGFVFVAVAAATLAPALSAAGTRLATVDSHRIDGRPPAPPIPPPRPA